jgi:hypothetical protein
VDQNGLERDLAARVEERQEADVRCRPTSVVERLDSLEQRHSRSGLRRSESSFERIKVGRGRAGAVRLALLHLRARPRAQGAHTLVSAGCLCGQHGVVVKEKLSTGHHRSYEPESTETRAPWRGIRLVSISSLAYCSLSASSSRGRSVVALDQASAQPRSRSGIYVQRAVDVHGASSAAAASPEAGQGLSRELAQRSIEPIRSLHSCDALDEVALRRERLLHSTAACAARV